MSATADHLPVVHLNGSGRQALLDQLEANYRALDQALTVLARSAPHQRDYYVAEPGRWGRALDAYERRYRALEALRDEFMADYHALAAD